MTECPICVCSYTPSLNKAIKCERCPFTACKKCVQYYLLNTETLPRCMDCHVPWTRPFLVNNLPRTWVNSLLKNHVEGVLISQEKSLIPATMPAVESHKALKELMDNVAKADEIRHSCFEAQRQASAKLEATRFEYFALPVEQRSLTLTQELDALVTLKDKAWTNYCDSYEQYRRATQDLYSYKNRRPRHVQEAGSSERRQFTYPCPAPSCRGFLSTAWKCMVCSAKVCSDCHEIKDGSTHECRDEDVQTAKTIKSETKPCPNCGVRIFKTSGCDQMFCTVCNTPFSWETGKVVSGAIHNPHYFDWLRKQNPEQAVGVDQVDQFCNDRGRAADTIYRTRFRNHSTNFFETFSRMLVHVRTETLPSFRIDRNAVEANKELRIKYVIGEIDEETWKILIQRREKKAQKNRDLHNVFQLLVQAGQDMVTAMIRDRDLFKDDDGVVLQCLMRYEQEMKGLLTFIADTLDEVAKNYESCIHKTFTAFLRNELIPMQIVPTKTFVPNVLIDFKF